MSALVKEVHEEEIRSAVAEKLGTSNFTLTAFKVRPASDNPLGFLGEHVRINTTVTVNGKTKEIQMFAKKVPSKVKSHYDYANATRAFYKEIELYKTLLKDIANSIDKNRKTKKWLPEFYYARGWEVFIVEDLEIDGYYMLPERTVMDLEHVKVATEAMAIMHAGSFIFEEKLNAGKVKSLSSNYVPNKKTTIGELYSHLTFETEASDVKGHPGNTFWEAGLRSQIPVIDLLPDYTPSQRKMVKDNIISKLRKSLDFVKPSEKFRNILLHGDLWANNMMFQKDKNDAVTNAIILDFQLARYGPPAHDLMMFLYLVQTREFRNKHENEVFDLYYATLSAELAAEGIDVKGVLPRSEFDETVEYFREYAVINSVMYFQLILTPADITGKFLSSPELFDKNMHEDRSEMILTCYREDEICRNRMTEAMREVAEYYNWV